MGGPFPRTALCEKSSAFSDTLILIYSKLCAKLSDLIDHLEYQVVSKIVLGKLDNNNPFFVKNISEKI